jgi:cyclin H
VTAAYLACKVEEFNVTMEQFVSNINGNKEKATDIILNHELLLMSQLNFQLTVHNPWRPVEGMLIDIKTRLIPNYPNSRMDPEKFRPSIEKFLDEVVAFTSATLIYAPSQVKKITIYWMILLIILF